MWKRNKEEEREKSKCGREIRKESERKVNMEDK